MALISDEPAALSLQSPGLIAQPHRSTTPVPDRSSLLATSAHRWQAHTTILLVPSLSTERFQVCLAQFLDTAGQAGGMVPQVPSSQMQGPQDRDSGPRPHRGTAPPPPPGTRALCAPPASCGAARGSPHSRRTLPGRRRGQAHHPPPPPRRRSQPAHCSVPSCQQLP